MDILKQRNRILVIIFMIFAIAFVCAAAIMVGIDRLAITGASHVGASVACCLALLSIYFGINRKMYENKRSKGVFLCIVIVIFACCISDSLAWIMSAVYPDALIWEYVKAGVVIISHLASLLFIIFVKEIIVKLSRKAEPYFKILVIFLFIFIAFLICFSTFGGYFSISDGKLHCDGVSMAMLIFLTVIIYILLTLILLNSKVSKSWVYVGAFSTFIMFGCLVVCFLFDNPMILHLMLSACPTFAYCTIFVEANYTNNEINKNLKEYIETDAKLAKIDDKLIEDSKAAIIVCQLRNMISLSNYFDQNIIIDIYNTFLDKIDKIVKENKGILMQPVMFEIKCIFKYGSAVNNQYVYDAIAAAKDILSAVEALNDYSRTKKYPSVYVGIAVDEGEVFLGPMGGGGHTQYTASGELVNDCNFLESNCSEGEILVSENVMKATEEKLHITDKRKIKSANGEEDIHVYRLGF